MNTRGVYLKLIRIEDLKELFSILKTEEAIMLSDEFGYNFDEGFFTKVFTNKLNSSDCNFMYFLAYTKSNKVIGYASITKIDFINGSAETNILLKKAYMGVGYGCIVDALVRQICFNELNLVKKYELIKQNNENIPERKKLSFFRDIPEGAGGSKTYYYEEILR